jgi:hypothetical protein
METTPLVYIASPFFDEFSKKYVGIKEKEFQGMKVPYFSPREDGINFKEVQEVDLRSERIKAIFKNNVRNLDKCEHLCINLCPVKGKTDIGTLWELGYFIAKHGDPHFDTDEYSTLMAPGVLKDLVYDWINYLSGATVPDVKGKSKKVLLIHNASKSKVEKSFELTDMNYDVYEVPTNLSIDTSKLTKNTVMLTDFWPDQMFVLAGWMYANKLPYYTASFNDFGSNVMMAASSKGHIKLPGLVDDTYREDLK